MPQHRDLDKLSGHIHKSKEAKSHPRPGRLGEASTHDQNNEYFEIIYERQASKSGVQQKKENEKEISIGTILPTRQISQCLYRSFQFHTQSTTGHLWEGWISHVVTIPQDAILPPALVPSVNSELLNSCRVPALLLLHFRLESSRIFAHVSFYTSECLTHWEEVGTHIFPPSGQKCNPAAIHKAREGQLMFLAANFDNFHLWARNRNNKNLTFIQFRTIQKRWSVHMRFSASDTENQDKLSREGWHQLESSPRASVGLGAGISSCARNLMSYHPHHTAALFYLQEGERRGERSHGFRFLSPSLLKCQIFLIKVRKRFSANIKASDISVLCFPSTASPIHEQTPSFQCFPNVRHEQTSLGIQSNQKIKPGVWFPRYNPEIQ